MRCPNIHLGGGENAGAHGNDAQKKTLRVAHRDTDRVKQMREVFRAEQAKLDAATVHFVDECATNDAMVPTYGRAPKGSPALGTKPRARGNHLTVIGVLSIRDGLTTQPWPGSLKAPDFESWVEAFLLPKVKAGDTVIMDNCSIHKREETIAMIEGAGGRVLFLAPYSPEYNPIEEAWSKFKNLLRRASASTRDALCEAIAMAARQITHQDTLGYVRHAGYLAST
jgi:transposase